MNNDLAALLLTLFIHSFSATVSFETEIQHRSYSQTNSLIIEFKNQGLPGKIVLAKLT